MTGVVGTRSEVGGLLAPAEAFAAALRGAPYRVVGWDRGPLAGAVERWQGRATPTDLAMVRRCRGATVDIGCGPGRMTEALMERGIAALGIDVVGEAVEQANGRGAVALQRDVFRPLPGEGRWGTALLADGNIGIGGDIVRLLGRATQLVAPDGRIVAEVDPPGGHIEVHDVALEVAGRRTPRFRWATVPADRLAALAEMVAMRVVALEDLDGRYVATLRRAV